MHPSVLQLVKCWPALRPRASDIYFVLPTTRRHRGRPGTCPTLPLMPPPIFLYIPTRRGPGLKQARNRRVPSAWLMRVVGDRFHIDRGSHPRPQTCHPDTPGLGTVPFNTGPLTNHSASRQK